LRAHPALTSDAGQPRYRIGQALVLPWLTRQDLDRPRVGGTTLSQALGSHGYLTGEDLDEGLADRLRALIPANASAATTDIDAVRAALYPALQVRWGNRLVVLDPEQDRLVRLPDQGHQVVEGPAGCGKTLTLVARARYLRERHPAWRILVLTFNRIAADLLRHVLVPDAQLEIAHFHSWCWRLLDRAGLDIPKMDPIADRSVYWTETIPQLMLQQLKGSQMAQARFDAILIDDGHDFVRSWYDVVLQTLNSRPGSLFITRDPHQVSDTPAREWRDLGILAGQPHRLRTNYRIPHQIFRAAEALIAPSAEAGAPRTSDRVAGPKGGFAPDIRRFPSAEVERKQAFNWLRKKLSSQVAPEQILVLGLLRPEMAELETWLEDMGIPSRLVSGRSLPGVLRLASIHGAKGLEADYVLLLQAHQLDGLRRSDARRLLYTAASRTRLQLSIYSHADSPLLDEFDAILNPRTVTPWDPSPRRSGASLTDTNRPSA
jgi:superfamily I DNA/RNA helicase